MTSLLPLSLSPLPQHQASLCSHTKLPAQLLSSLILLMLSALCLHFLYSASPRSNSPRNLLSYTPRLGHVSFFGWVLYTGSCPGTWHSCSHLTVAFPPSRLLGSTCWAVFMAYHQFRLYLAQCLVHSRFQSMFERG